MLTTRKYTASGATPRRKMYTALPVVSTLMTALPWSARRLASTAAMFSCSRIVRNCGVVLPFGALNSIIRSYTLLHDPSFALRTRYTKPNTLVLAPAITLNDQKSTTRHLWASPV